MNNKILVVILIVLSLATVAMVLKKNRNYAAELIVEAPPASQPMNPPVQPTPPPVAPKPILTPKTYAEAVALAKAENKPVFVYFSMNGCGPCVTFKSTLSTPEVKKALEKYVVYHVALEKEPDVFDDFKVRSTPSYFVVDADGKTLKSGSGAKGSKEFINWLGKI